MRRFIEQAVEERPQDFDDNLTLAVIRRNKERTSMSAGSSTDILVLSNTQAKALAGSLLAIGEEIYRFKDYNRAYPGQPPWRSGPKARPIHCWAGRFGGCLPQILHAADAEAAQ